MANLTNYANTDIFTTVTIASGAGTATQDLHGTRLIAVKFPATMTNTVFDLERSEDSGATWGKIYTDAGVKKTVTVVSGWADLDPSDAYSLNGFIRLNGSNEGAERTLIFKTRPL